MVETEVAGVEERLGEGEGDVPLKKVKKPAGWWMTAQRVIKMKNVPPLFV